MIPQVLPPDVGSGLKASWGASVASAINQLANGLETRAKPLENQRNRRGGSGGVTIAGPFEPIFEDGKLVGVESGFIPFGRSFYRSTPEFRDTDTEQWFSNNSHVLVGLEITHPTTSTDYPTAKICNIAINYTSNSLFNGSKEFTILPLYEIENGSIKCDYRCYMALAIRE